MDRAGHEVQIRAEGCPIASRYGPWRPPVQFSDILFCCALPCSSEFTCQYLYKSDRNCCAGWLYLEARDFAKADKAFEKLVSEVAKNDDYGWLGLASLTLTSIPSRRKKVQNEKP